MKQKWYVPWLYIAPTLLILGLFLVYPTVETIWVSFHDNYYRPSEDKPTTFVGLDNYIDAFDDSAMGVAFRNNALWLVLMTTFTVGMGLLLAVLLDRVRYEAVGKSIIFLPMAISFTAASVIWRFIYAYRPPSKNQIGFLNGTLTALKDFVSNPVSYQILNALLWVFGSLALVLILIILAKAVGDALRTWKVDQHFGSLASTIVGGFVLLGAHYVLGWLGASSAGAVWYFLWLAFGSVGAVLLVVLGLRDRSLGAYFVVSLTVALLAQFVLNQADFEPQFWLSLRPWINNISLIVAGIWVWTGFCMVILSAAYKAIPAELLEAARIDGSNEWQVFRHITIPFMKPTIAVVTTTIIIFVLKTFDIVYVMTNGNYGTEVLANRMIKTMYTFPPDYGKSSAIAVFLLILIIPFIIINIRRFQAQEAIR